MKKVLTNLCQNPRPSGCEKLAGTDGWRIRVGDYRILYAIDDKIKLVTIYDSDHRREVYR
jgi:mRNA interferase RelE/StbE